MEKKSRQKNNKMHVILIAFFLVYAAMAVFFVWYNLSKQSELFNNTYNSRQELMAEQNIRGTIYSADGEKLAHTVTTEDGTEKRVYPFGETFCHVIGYASHGKSGVEALANYDLSHSNISITDKLTSSISGRKNPADDVFTTFDTNLQQVADKAMGVYEGAIIVTEVKTGRVLAMVSKPGFDPNDIATLFQELSEDEESSVLLNRATQGLYPPGSIFKVVTSLEYLRENNNDLSNYSYNCNGSFSLGKTKVSCFNHKAHGYQTYENSVTNSCNSSFANIGVGLNLDSFANTLDGLLFNQKMPIDLPYSISSYDLVGDGTEDAIIQSSFGQGKTIVTPLLMNMITSAIANDGQLMKPQVLDSVKAADGTPIKEYTSSVYKRLLTREEAQILTDLMVQVVKVGTASKLNGLSYSVAGKTGSAEYDSSKEFSHAWFTGFAPAEEPEIAVTVIMEEAGTGSSYAVPAAKRIFDAYFGVE